MWELCCGTIHKQKKTAKSYNYFRGDYDSLNSYFKEMDWSSRFNDHDIDYNYNLFAETVSLAIDIKTHGSVSCSQRSRCATPVCILKERTIM